MSDIERPRALVLKAPGTNCDIETSDALERAGADTDVVTTGELFADPEQLLRYRILVLPGGFAHGDDVASARILAIQMRQSLGAMLMRFVDDEEGYVLGICNGFQALVKLGLLPRTKAGTLQQEVSLVHNDSGHYECRWVDMLPMTDCECRLVDDGIVQMPVGHGEGKFVPGPDFDPYRSEHVVLRYMNEQECTEEYPYNPNGSVDGIAAICDTTGRVLGMMPHPDRAYLPWQHPERLHKKITEDDMSGALLFRRLVEFAGR